MLGIIATLTVRQQQQVVCHHLCYMALITLFIFPRAALQTAFNINLGTFVKDTLGDIGQSSPAHHIVPFGDFYSFIVAVATVFGCCEGERGFFHWRRPLGRECDYIWIFSYVTYKDYFINSNHTYFLVKF